MCSSNFTALRNSLSRGETVIYFSSKIENKSVARSLLRRSLAQWRITVRRLMPRRRVITPEGAPLLDELGKAPH
jgi:hypothetical protein